ncbi:cell division protein FtsZ [Rhizobium leguminosarum]|uniref:cell division protein FtsZ n=1 Tax=Rhizobium leguminosarum TaxID=384 RepID=UPI0024B3432E|nr:cell division protein FtsZ [Rhizobium leguminosarum]WHO84125.1 cell division protein FtsZ [Rhizobium leguminosarum]
MMHSLQKPAGWKPKIVVIGVGGGGGNAVDNMITQALSGVDFLVANTDAQALVKSKAPQVVQLGLKVTEGLGAGSHPAIGRAAAEESIHEIMEHLAGYHMCFIAGGMGGGTGTGAAPVIARAARQAGILTVAVVTEPFVFEGSHRMRQAKEGIEQLLKVADTVIVVPNQSLFRLSAPHTTLAEAFASADAVLYAGVSSIVDLILKEGAVNLDFADVKAIMRDMGMAVMGTGDAAGPGRATASAKAALENPLFGDAILRDAKAVLVSISAGRDLTLFEVDEAAGRIREQVDGNAEIIFGASFDESLGDRMRVSLIATGIGLAARAPLLVDRVA